MVEPDNSVKDDPQVEPWDGPPMVPPDNENNESEREEAKKPIGVNELRIVRGIEESLSNKKGPRIQVIKSRDIANARSFSEKVFRVLKMHGYRIHPLNMDNINTPVEASNTDSVTIYTIDEDTMKNYLGNKLGEMGSPMQHLFKTSMLSSVKNPVLISTVSDAFYNWVNPEKFNVQEPENRVTEEKAVKASKGSTQYRVASFYLVAAAFILSALNSVVGNYIVIGDFNGTVYTPIPFLIFVFSISAIAIRSFGLGSENRKSMYMIAVAIVLFIVLFVSGEILQYYLSPYSVPFVDAVKAILQSSSNYFMMLIGIVVTVLSLSRYFLFLGSDSARASYFLSSVGLALIVVVILISLQPFETLLTPPIFGTPGTVGSVVSSHFVFMPYFPMFGTSNYFNITGTPQYYFIRNYILLVANLILAVSFLVAVRRSSWNRSRIQPSQ